MGKTSPKYKFEISNESLKFPNSYQSSNLFTTEFKINSITTKYFKANNTLLSSNGATVLHYSMKSVRQLFLGNELLFLNPRSLRDRLFKTGKMWKQKYFQQMLVPTRMY
jgi:hypothetical protein